MHALHVEHTPHFLDRLHLHSRDDSLTTSSLVPDPLIPPALTAMRYARCCAGPHAKAVFLEELHSLW